MFACLEDTSVCQSESYPAGGVSGRRQQTDKYQQHESDRVIERLAFEGQELRRKLKQLSSKLYQIESERCAERVEFQKQLDTKDHQSKQNPGEMYEMNTKYLTEITQLRDIKDRAINSLREECKSLNEGSSMKDAQIKSLTQMLSEQTQGKDAEICMLRRDFEQEIASIMRRRDNTIDDQRASFLRRAMVAEAELEKTMDMLLKSKCLCSQTCNEINQKKNEEDEFDNLTALQAEIFSLQKEVSELKQCMVDSNLEYEKVVLQLGCTKDSLLEVTEERDSQARSLDSIFKAKYSIEECVRRVQEENQHLRDRLIDVTSRQTNAIIA
jgi:hypothetical protein